MLASSLTDGAAAEIVRTIETERRETVIRHTPRAFAVLYAFGLVTGMVEWAFRPSHRFAGIVASLVYVLATGTHYLVTRVRPQHSVGSVVLVANAVCAGMLMYSVLVHGKGELVVMVLGVMLGAFAVMFPVGFRNQLLASVTALIGYPIVLQLGTTLVSSWWYSGLSLLAFVTVFAIGASLIDEYRSRVLRDALGQARMAQENSRLLEQAQAADRAKTEFLSTVSHELRTPLSVIVGYLDLLLDGTFEAHEQPDVQRRIREQADLMLNLVQALLDLNRVTSGNLRVTIEDFDLRELLERLRSNLPSSWRSPGVELLWNSPAEPLAMHTDRGKLEMIIRNLIHNALKYTRQGSVTVQVEALPDTVRVIVSDTGEGIASEDLPNIFAMFGQGTRSPPRGGGVGLGLHIVKRFTEVLGGKVSVESRAGVGTKFTVTIPRQLVEPESSPPATTITNASQAADT